MNCMNIYQKAFKLLLDEFGEQYWWPAESPLEVCVGAVMVQNTNWRNAAKAIEQLKANNVLEPQKILDLPLEDLSRLIRPSGFQRLKAVRLKAVMEWWLALRHDTETGELRKSLLTVNGVGPETADAILLYALERPVFVIDAYTRRIAARHLGTAPDIDYYKLQRLFTGNLPEDTGMFNEYHALLVQNAKVYCRKSECLMGCPLRKLL